MPCLEITMPEATPEEKEQLAQELTESFGASTNFEAEIFSIYFKEYGNYAASTGGVLWYKEGNTSPYIHFNLYCPRIDRTVKKNIVRTFTDIFKKVMKQEQYVPVIHICEHAYDNIGINGEILSEAYEACANKKFYYTITDYAEQSA